MKYFELDKKEEKMLKDFESGKLKRVRNAKKEISLSSLSASSSS